MCLERICTSTSYSSLQVLELGYDGSVADISMWLDRLSSMIENMQELKTLDLNNSSLTLTTVQIQPACNQGQ